MAKRIKTISELPKWFQLDKYENAKKLNTLGWLEQLSVRSDILMIISSHISRGHDYTCEILENFRENPIIDLPIENDAYYAYLGGPITELKQKKAYYTLGVQAISARQLLIHKLNCDQVRWDYLMKWHNQLVQNARCSKKQINDYKKKFKYKTPDWIDNPLYDSYTSNVFTTEHVCVNMELPDNILIDHFKQFLAKRRAEKYDKLCLKPYRQPDFNDWIRFGVLPYLDLKIWELEEKVTIPNRVMADAIFLPGECGEETVRKTTKSLVASLIKQETIEQLVAKAALEISEKQFPKFYK